MNPAIDPNGNQYWYNSDGELHREDGPAFIRRDGIQGWCINGKCHRTDGPAYIGTGTQYWYLNDNIIFSNKQFQEVSGISDEDMTIMVLKYGNVS